MTTVAILVRPDSTIDGDISNEMVYYDDVMSRELVKMILGSLTVYCHVFMGR